MIGCYDFCGHYDWTFAWLERRGGKDLLHMFWDECIHTDSQKHASAAIAQHGLEGMKSYWGHTLDEESPEGGYAARVVGDRFFLELQKCPSRGFLLRNSIGFSSDYCDHCIGWIGPMMKRAGYKVNHAHNHLGQCYWEFYRDDEAMPVDEDARAELEAIKAGWHRIHAGEGAQCDVFKAANSPADKTDDADNPPA